MLDGILDGMGKVVHGINAPLVSSVVMAHTGHTVDHRVSHIDVGGRHIDLGAEHLFPVLIHAVLHFLEELQVLLHRSVPVGAVFSRSVEISPVFPDLIGRKVADECLSFFDQMDCTLIHCIKVVRRKKQPVLKFRAQPFHVVYDGLHILRFFLRGVRIIKTEIEFSAVFLCQSRIQDNGLGMSDVEISVGLRWESRLDMVIYALRQVFIDFLFNKIFRNCFFRFLCRFYIFRHSDSSIYVPVFLSVLHDNIVSYHIFPKYKRKIFH